MGMARSCKTESRETFGGNEEATTVLTDWRERKRIAKKWLEVLTVLSDLYGFSRRLPEIEMAERQYDQVTPAMNDNPALKDMVERFERGSDEEVPGDPPVEGSGAALVAI